MDFVLLLMFIGIGGYLSWYIQGWAVIFYVFCILFILKQFWMLPKDIRQLQYLARNESHPQRFYSERNAIFFYWLLALAVLNGVVLMPFWGILFS